MLALDSMTTTFRNGVEFPNEGFVQGALDKHFAALGFTVPGGSRADIDLLNPETGQHWVVEAKGDTKGNAGLDFKTGLGQLLLRMNEHEPETMYGVALPDTPRFVVLCSKISKRVRLRLNLHCLLVDGDSTIRVISPSEPVETK